MKRILVTGGCGFIGSHTCLALLEKGYEVWVIDSFVNGSPESLERVKKIVNSTAKLFLFNGDLRDEKFIKEVFLKGKSDGSCISAVIHFAGLKAVSESIIQPVKYWEFNVKTTINLLNIMSENKCNTIVFSSSATIFGNTNINPINELAEIKPINPYGNTKAAIEKILNDIYQSSPNEWRISSLRYFNPIGAHGSGIIGEDPSSKPQNIFPLLLNVAIGKIKLLKIFGNDWPTPDGTAIRDYIHVIDLANAHVKTLELLLNEKPQIMNINLGTAKGTSVLELINTFEEVNNIKIPYEFAARREGDVCKLIADNSLAFSRLNWIPIKNISDMCLDGWKWQKSNPKGYV